MTFENPAPSIFPNYDPISEESSAAVPGRWSHSRLFMLSFWCGEYLCRTDDNRIICASEVVEIYTQRQLFSQENMEESGRRRGEVRSRSSDRIPYGMPDYTQCQCDSIRIRLYGASKPDCTSACTLTGIHTDTCVYSGAAVEPSSQGISLQSLEESLEETAATGDLGPVPVRGRSLNAPPSPPRTQACRPPLPPPWQLVYTTIMRNFSKLYIELAVLIIAYNHSRQ
ncbi:unnamed protein product [Danaus chrysippus]|uniref:(African queen) hypothetical protein n=1 Tax=Danaus chrysippus TaxID=151541 RepID=A0A8J2W292_9NEOP|nr:unnamed protein product [Danaus chrysippus]